MPFITQGKTNLKYILIIVVLVVIVGGGILVWQYWWVPREEVETVPEEKIEKKEMETKETRKALSECEAKPEQASKELCYMNAAELAKDVSICDRIITQILKNNCYSNVAQASDNPSICEELLDQAYRDNCYWSFAFFKRDLSVCEKIQGEKTRSECVTLIKEFEELREERPAKEARDARRASHLHMIKTALNLYYADHNSYPVLEDTSEDGKFLKVLVEEKIMDSVLLDPKHPNYYYEYYGSKNSFILKCFIEVEGGFHDMLDGKKDHAYTITQ